MKHLCMLYVMVQLMLHPSAQSRRDERGASAIEWAIISGVIVVLALLVAAAVRSTVQENISNI